MLTEEEKEIYNRHLILDKIGEEGQLRLKNSSVLVIGAGGLGCPMLQYLAAAGVGSIGIIDGDVVEASNLQRQILFGHTSIGQSKAIEARKRLNDLNPYIKVNAIAEHLSIENAKDIISAYDIMVDCTDNYPTRYLVNDVCVLLGKPLVYGAIHKFEGQVTVFNYENGPTYRCLYPELPSSASTANCSESGVIGVLPGIVGILQANEVIKMITQMNHVLSGKLLVYSSTNNQMRSYTIERKSSEFYASLMSGKELVAQNYEQYCEAELNKDLTTLVNTYEQVIDVREMDEQPLLPQLGAIQIPLGEIEDRAEEIDGNKKTLVFCRSGRRSDSAISKLKALGLELDLHNLEGGIIAYHNSN